METQVRRKLLLVDAIFEELLSSNGSNGNIKGYFDFECDKDFSELEEKAFNVDFNRCHIFDYFVEKGMLEEEDRDEYNNMYGEEVFNSELS